MSQATLDHFAKLFYNVDFAKGVITYSLLQCEYIEQVIMEGVRGPARIGEPNIRRFELKNVFATSSLCYEEIEGPRRYRFFLSLELRELWQQSQEVRNALVLPAGLTGVPALEAARFRKAGAIDGYIVGQLVSNYASDILRATKLAENVLHQAWPPDETVERLYEMLVAQRFSPGRHMGFTPRTQDSAYVPVEIHGTYIYKAVQRILEPR